MMKLLEGRTRIAGTKIFNENENIDYKEFKEVIIIKINSKKIT